MRQSTLENWSDACNPSSAFTPTFGITFGQAMHGLSLITILVAIFVTSFIHVPRNWNCVHSHITRFALDYNGCYDCIDPFLPVPWV